MPAAVRQNFPGYGLAFTVGIGGDHYAGGLFQQLFDNAELFTGVRPDVEFPLLWDDGQRFGFPLFNPRVVIFRYRHCQQMAKAPGHSDGRALQAAIALAGGVEHTGDITRLRGFFAQIELHKEPPLDGEVSVVFCTACQQGELKSQ